MFILSFFIAMIISALATAGVIRIARHFNILDTPTPRKRHSRPTPLLGGVAVFIAFVVTAFVFWVFGYVTDPKIGNGELLAILLAGLVLIIGGVLDDKYNLTPRHQILFPVVATGLVVLSGIRIEFTTNPFGGILHFGILSGSLLSFVWILGMIYTTKFLDGLDGLVSGITAIGSIIIFIVSLEWDVPQSATSYFALMLAGSCIGFLLFNWHPAKIFLGESGSVFCGFMLGVLAIISGSKIATALLIMGIPILDVAWVITRRILQGNSVAQSDRKHLHFRLLEIGFSHRQTVLFLYFITGIFGTVSLFLHSRGKVLALLCLGLSMALIAVFIVNRNKNASKI